MPRCNVFDVCLDCRCSGFPNLYFSLSARWAASHLKDQREGVVFLASLLSVLFLDLFGAVIVAMSAAAPVMLHEVTSYFLRLGNRAEARQR